MLIFNRICLVIIGVAFMSIPATTTLALGKRVIDSKPILTSTMLPTSVSALTKVSSNSWAGYAATGANKKFTSVSSSWVEPTATCSANQTSYAAFWVGMDGYSDSTVEQVGSEADCINGTPLYYTWYELYPQNPNEVITSVSVTPGDSLTASVTYSPSVTKKVGKVKTTTPAYFTLSLKDNTTGATTSTIEAPSDTPDRNSAEVVAEAPYSNGVLPLTDFGTASFDSTTVNGTAIGTATNLQEFTMNDPIGMVATPSALDSTKENFTVSWSD